MIQKYLRHFLKNKRQQPPAKYAGWQHVQHFLLIIEGNEEAAKKLTLALTNEGKQLDVLAYLPTKRPKEGAPKQTFYTNDLNLMLEPKPIIFSEMQRQYDVLLLWPNQQREELNHVAAAIQANLKICVGNPNDLYHFVVANNPNADLCINEIIKYLKIINT
jgi:hypothetical protein